MRFVRVQVDGRAVYGVLEGETVREIDGSIFGDYRVSDRSHRLDQVKLLVPCEPTKLLALARNYRSHVDDPSELSPRPEIFFKTVSALLPNEGTIVIPKEAGQADYEGEMVAVIGRGAKNVSREDALSYVLGYTCGNDVSVREWQNNDVQWWRAKSCDTFAPVGPWIVTGLDPSKQKLTLHLNGEVKQETVTSLLIHDVATIISFASRHLTLEPGDLIYTGTPGKTSPMKDGDLVEVEVDGIGVLRNRVAVEK